MAKKKATTKKLPAAAPEPTPESPPKPQEISLARDVALGHGTREAGAVLGILDADADLEAALELARTTRERPTCITPAAGVTDGEIVNACHNPGALILVDAKDPPDAPLPADDPPATD